ncbi:MAG: tetratricopeptide repeat protein [Culturomica sp.]|nr:tetratricopeptide repeat protein [Culturomica sp.]
MNNIVKFCTVCLLLANSTIIFAQTKTFTRDYTYQASEDDSRNSARTQAVAQLRAMLLREIGTYIREEQQTVVKGDVQEYTEKLEAITAGIVEMKILDDKCRWDGVTYYIVAEMTVDLKDVGRRVKAVSEDKQKTKALEDAREQTKIAQNEIAQLKKEMEAQREQMRVEQDKFKKQLAEERNKVLEQSYKKQIENLTVQEYITLGNSARENKQFEAAKAYYEKAKEIDPTNELVGISWAIALSDFHKTIYTESLQKVWENIKNQKVRNAQNINIPKWFFQPVKNQYVGVSFPLKDKKLAQQQAICSALLSYILQNDIEGHYIVDHCTYTVSGDDGRKSERGENMIRFNLPLKWEVEKTYKNSNGEVFVSLSTSPIERNSIGMEFYIQSRLNEKNGIKEMSQSSRFQMVTINTPNNYLTLHNEANSDGINGKIKIAADTQSNKTEIYYWDGTNQISYRQTTTPQSIIPLWTEALFNSLGYTYSMSLLNLLSNGFFWKLEQDPDAPRTVYRGTKFGIKIKSMYITNKGLILESAE